jgi:hypothetical protein
MIKCHGSGPPPEKCKCIRLSNDDEIASEIAETGVVIVVNHTCEQLPA